MTARPSGPSSTTTRSGCISRPTATGSSGELRTLTANRAHAFELLRLALTEPRFDPEPVERVRSQILADLRRREADPDYLASRAWFAAAFPGHPYGRPSRGTPESIAAITVDDCRAFVARHLARDRLVVGVAGDITRRGAGAAAGRHLRRPAGRRRRCPSGAGGAAAWARSRCCAWPSRRAWSSSAMAGSSATTPTTMRRYVANYILGGGGFSSRLLEEVREKRGLAYSAYSYLHELDAAPLWLGGVATNNQQVASRSAIVRAELARMARGELDETDLANARTYLTGSFPLRLTSNDQIAKMLVGMLVHDLGRDFLERRNAPGRGGDPGRPAPRLGAAVLGRAAGQRGGRPGGALNRHYGANSPKRFCRRLSGNVSSELIGCGARRDLIATISPALQDGQAARPLSCRLP